MKNKIAIFLWVFLSAVNCVGQNRNSVWCFGDSSGIDFSSGTAVPTTSGMDGRGSCASIADQNGNLLFYAATMRPYAAVSTLSTFVYDQNNNIMMGGDSITGRAWYQELVFVPNPANDSTYYLFSIGVTSGFGLYYSLIDMKQNGGLGSVTQKNIMLQTFEQVDCLNAIKHGNGRDWWVFFRKSDVPNGGANNDWYSYLVSPSGIQNFSVQSIGSQNRTNLGHITFSSDGTKMVFNNYPGVIELFDFDRCTGMLSNPVTIESDPGAPPYPFYWSNAFSPDDSKLYVTSSDTITYLFQYDLNSPNITASKDTLWTLNFPKYAGGALKLAPDNKIYLSTWYYNGMNLPYPYADSMYNMYNMNLSVINQPDSLGNSCDFQPFSFYLSGKRTYTGLPNNPNYEMPALAGSSCDTLVGTGEMPAINPALLNVFYHSVWEKAFINASNLKGKSGQLVIFDMKGKVIHEEPLKIQNGYFTKDLSMIGKAGGLYFIVVETDKERLTKKLVK